MRNVRAFLLAASIVTASLSAANNTVDFSGTWSIDSERSHQVVKRQPIFSRDGRKMSPREADPGIGWPGGTGPDGHPLPPNARSIKRYPEILSRYLDLLIVQTAKEVQITSKIRPPNGKFRPPNGKERTVIQKFSLDGSQDRNQVLSGQGEFISRCKWEKDSLVIQGKQVDQGAEMIVREEYSLSRDGKELSIRTSGYYRANEVNDPDSFKGSDSRWDATFKQVFNRK
jgi:hypothetical protein